MVMIINAYDKEAAANHPAGCSYCSKGGEKHASSSIQMHTSSEAQHCTIPPNSGVRAIGYLHGPALVQGTDGFASSQPCLAVRGAQGRTLVVKVVLPNYSSITSTAEQPVNFQPSNLPPYRQRWQHMEQVG